MPLKESPMTAKRALTALVFVSLAALFLAAAVPAAAQDMALDNGRLRAVFNDRGLASLSAPQTGWTLTFSADPASVTIEGAAFKVSVAFRGY
jgi:hypothetical protein